MILPNISEFIKRYITKRSKSLFAYDINENKLKLTKEIKGKSVLVIGGAGTIGSSFIKATLNFHPSQLYVVDINENGLTELTRTLRSNPKIKVPDFYLTYPISFNSKVFYKILDEHGPFDIVANFAAHKHVRSEKDIYSIEAMVNNNVIHAKKFLDYLKINKPSHFFCVSTDKAANPVNVMGASKKLMENVIMAYSTDLKITTARFANVAFSNGSLLFGYIQRLLQRQPISCPYDIKRFFVSPEESGEICLLTCILGNSGDIFFPKLEHRHLVSFKTITEDFFQFLNLPIKICNSEGEAKDYLLKNDENTAYPVYYFKTDTSGEKLYEEFYTKNDETDMNRFRSIGIIINSQKPNHVEVDSVIIKLNKLFYNNLNTKQDIIKSMKKLIPDFDHIETGKYLDQKM